jgi:hypothetical protein
LGGEVAFLSTVEKQSLAESLLVIKTDLTGNRLLETLTSRLLFGRPLTVTEIIFQTMQSYTWCLVYSKARVLSDLRSLVTMVSVAISWPTTRYVQKKRYPTQCPTAT